MTGSAELVNFARLVCVFLSEEPEVAVDFVANNPRLTRFHCHQQLRVDFGFMTLFDYVRSGVSACCTWR